MKLIAFTDPADFTLYNILNPMKDLDSSLILTFSKPEDFKNAVRKNVTPKPVIIFSASDISSLSHLIDIKEYLADTILLLIVPNEEYYQTIQNNGDLYPRYVFYREDDWQLLVAILDKIKSRQKEFKSVL